MICVELEAGEVSLEVTVTTDCKVSLVNNGTVDDTDFAIVTKTFDDLDEDFADDLVEDVEELVETVDCSVELFTDAGDDVTDVTELEAVEEPLDTILGESEDTAIKQLK